MREDKARADTGGHSAPESKLREIHRNSLANLPAALEDIDSVQVYDNSHDGRGPELVMETRSGLVTYLAEKTPDWLEKALWGTDYEISEQVRAQAKGERARHDLGFESLA